jgi:3-deoxy-D-manno-octulosonic-acid transferase
LIKKPDLLSLSNNLGRIFMRLAGLSWRVRYVHPASGRAGSERRRPVFFAFWHGRQLPLIHTHRDEGVTVLVSLNRDGQYVTNVLHSMGYNTVRGSSSRGGMNAIRETVRILRSGSDCAITPDGPRGPAEKAKSGISHIARLGCRPIVPMGSSAFPAIRFRSWDSFILPLPFAKVPVIEGRPIPPLTRSDDQQLWTERLETELNRVTATADLLASPSSMFAMRLLTSLGILLRPVSETALLFRSSQERKERRGYVDSPGGRPVWIHGSSLGELNGIIPFARHLRKNGIPVWITCFTPSGRSFLEKTDFSGSYIPLDIKRYTERFLQRVRPRALILAETEIWPAAVWSTIESDIPCMMINARLSSGSVKGYRFLGHLVGNMLSCFTGILARSGEDRDRFVSLGVDKSLIKVSMDSKLLADHGDPPPAWRIYLRTARRVLVAGSTREGEESIVVKAALSADYFPVVAPRHIERVPEVLDLMKGMGLSPSRWSDIIAENGSSLDFDCVVVDVHGILARLYGAGDAAFVGGTLVPLGGHNVYEPLLRGIPLIVGPHYSSFTEVVDKLSEKGAVHIASTEEEIAGILRTIRSTPLEEKIVHMEYEAAGENVMSDFTSLLRRSGITG